MGPALKQQIKAGSQPLSFRILAGLMWGHEALAQAPDGGARCAIPLEAWEPAVTMSLPSNRQQFLLIVLPKSNGSNNTHVALLLCQESF